MSAFMYLPFTRSSVKPSGKAAGRPSMGLKPLALKDWIEIGPNFNSQLALKAQLLKQRYDDVFIDIGNTHLAQQEVRSLLTTHLLTHYPQIYQPLGIEKGSDRTPTGIYNAKTQQTLHFSDFESAPLELAARLVQEDLCILLPAPEPSTNPASATELQTYHLAAASVCFPLRWSLREKMGKSVANIHQPVPEYPKRLARPVDTLFSRLRGDAPSLRFNWSVVDSPELHLIQKRKITHINPYITTENIANRLWLRVEKQTLRRLPISQGILFTIRTFIYPIATVTADPNVAKQLAQAILQLQPEVQSYKNLLPIKQTLLSYLDSCSHPASNHASTN
ncbi:MAG: DUF3445 domain-containing protein [Cyanobacteria bacterium J06626_6]